MADYVLHNWLGTEIYSGPKMYNGKEVALIAQQALQRWLRDSCASIIIISPFVDLGVLLSPMPEPFMRGQIAEIICRATPTFSMTTFT